MASKVFSVFVFFFCTNCVNCFWTPPPTDLTSSATSTTTDSTTTATASTLVGEEVSHDSEDGAIGSKGLIIIGNVESNLFAYYNVTGNVALEFDVDNYIIALTNGSTTSGVYICVDNKKGVYVSDSDSIVREESERQYLTSLKKGLKPNVNQENAVDYSLDDVPTEILKSINGALVKLVDDVSEVLERNPKVGFNLFEAIGTQLLGLQQGPLRGYITVLGIKGITIQGDLVRSANVIKGLAAVYGRVPGGIPALLEAGAKIRFQKIADSRNGLVTLAELIREIGSVKNVGDVLGDLLNDPESLLKLLNLLGGNFSNGVNGVLKVIGSLAQFSNGGRSLEYVINVMIQFLAANSQNDADPKQVASELDQSISEVIEAIDEAQGSDSLSEAVKVLRSLKEENLKINRVKISSLISRLISSIDKPKKLQILVNVLLELREVVQIEELLPRLLLVLILNLNTPLGIHLLERVGIPTEIDTNESSGGIIERILKSVSNITSRLLHDLYEGLCSVPAFDKLIKSTNSAISECGVDRTLKELLRSNDVAESLIKAILQVVGGLRLDAPDDTCSRVRETVEACSSVNFYLSIDVNVTITE